MEQLSAEALVRGCAEDSLEAGVTIRTLLEPLGPPGSPVKPATYEGGRFQADRRWWGDGAARRAVDVLVIDNEPSQANRLEAALAGMRAELGLPEIVLDLAETGSLPPHLPTRISIFQFPHRNADAYLRDAQLDGVSFPKTSIGQAIFDATADDPEALLQWCPQALLFGFWQSHLGKKRSHAKLARAWVSEILGVEPATDAVRRMGVKGDPLNLSADEPVAFSSDSTDDWSFVEKGKGKGRLSELGHGQVPVSNPPLAGVSFREVVQQSTVSFASLRRVRLATGAAEARALLAALGLVGHVAAFGRPFSLRSGADLRAVNSAWTWHGEVSREVDAPSGLDDVIRLFRECVELADAAGLPVGSRWASEPLVLQPAANLTAAIRKTWPSR